MSFVAQTEVSTDVSNNLPTEGEVEGTGGTTFVIVPPPLVPPMPPVQPPPVSPVK
jgi:hypothetical protein